MYVIIILIVLHVVIYYDEPLRAVTISHVSVLKLIGIIYFVADHLTLKT